jgi:hypothetical protein
MRHQACDRMQFRYVVNDLSHCRAWLAAPERELMRCSNFERLLDFEEPGDPEHWWIASQPVRARFDRTWRPVVLELPA